MSPFGPSTAPICHGDVLGSHEPAPWRAPGSSIGESSIRSSIDTYEQCYATLAAELNRSAVALGRLAPVVDALVTSLPGPFSAIPALEQSLQRTRSDNAYLLDFVRRQRQTIETQSQEVAILSQEVAKLRNRRVQQASREADAMHSLNPSESEIE
ncbi:uncharacterized protein N7498_007868 [Penicillium cinerascens]|uniref:Uncharacterized protein n=1 Tax=Penicillium cinerascens TaxID=70096 RepID=A0A9W9JRT3_9EURO|nr:uncharacterized protein N7498_007868 [Penicillium cinerascens]KAJ5198751.1 hypothetical protein N7498_007868 [Penicillium cinerascens]